MAYRCSATGDIVRLALVAALLLWLLLGGWNLGRHRKVQLGGETGTMNAQSEPAETHGQCNDPEWCTLQMPARSHFRFAPPSNASLWRAARVLAMTGEQVLLKKAIEAIANPMDFLVGDINFREYHAIVDYFLDHQHGFLFLSGRNESARKYLHPLPEPYLPRNRAILVAASYPITQASQGPHSNPLLFGLKKRVYFQPLSTVLRGWMAAKARIRKPFILMSSFDENWGLLSTYFPNRTADWFRCCSAKQNRMLATFLNDPKVLMLLVNQHHNQSHPKIISLPRGLPIFAENQRKLLWDTMIHHADEPKRGFVYTASSSWGSRPAIARCLVDRLDAYRNRSDIHMELFEQPLANRIDEKEYYTRLVSSRLSIALPGIGYDTFRLWESMTMGVLPVLEKGVGLDKTLWRLPALLVEDFAQVTPALLRTAYVEAIYRALSGEFEFQRLRQSYWWSFIFAVAAAQSSSKVQEFFPAESEDGDFMRPLEAFSCHGRGGCGRGTKRTPVGSCAM